MIQISPRYRKVLAHPTRAIGAVAVAAGMVAATAGTASAAPGYDTAFSVTDQGGGVQAVHIGIDVHMSQQDAEAIIAPDGEEFSATIMGDDWNWDNALFNVPVTWSAAWEGGLSAEFDRVVSSSWLNEDPEGRDEVYARVRLYDPRTGSTRTFTTNVIYRYF